ncbi:hydrogenase maturation protease [Telmatospirillum sp.]|uniref:hydrogenase maturation protease n=1 Tax=Telmatospirillum sp. TaxID=2079197 RepID=UPI00386ACA05
MTIGAEPLVIGVGNSWRRDDGVGAEVVERLRGKLPTLELPGEGTELIEAWRDTGWVIVIDAMRSGGPVGTILHIDAAAGPLPKGRFSCLSHQFGLAEAVEMARLLGRLPPKIEIYGIEAADLGQGKGLSPAVEAAAIRLSADLLEMRR